MAGRTRSWAAISSGVLARWSPPSWGGSDISWYTYNRLGCSMLVRKINHHWADCITNIAANYWLILGTAPQLQVPFPDIVEFSRNFVATSTISVEGQAAAVSRLQCHVIAGLGADPHYTEYTDRDTEVNYKPFIWGNTVILYLTYAALTSQITRVIPAPGTLPLVKHKYSNTTKI